MKTLDPNQPLLPNQPTRFPASWALPVAVIASVGMLSPAAFAQQRAGGSGRALDANQRSGSGRTNQLEGQVDYQARNNLITGNAPGGRSFRGRVGYTAPGELRTPTGSDALFQFRRESLGSSPLIQGNDRLDYRSGGGATQAPLSVYRNFSGPGSYSNSGQQLREQSRLNSNAQASSLNAPEQTGGTNTLGDILSRQQAGNNSGLGGNAGFGSRGAIQASPLLGVRRFDPSANQGNQPGQSNPDHAQGVGDDDQPRSQSQDRAADDPDLRSNALDGSLPSRSLGEASRLGSGRLGIDQAKRARLQASGEPILTNRSLPAGVLLGRRLQGVSRTTQSGQGRQQLAQRFSRLDQTLLGEPGSTRSTTRGSVYQNLVDSMNRQTKRDTLGGKSNRQPRQTAKGPDQWTTNNQQSNDETASTESTTKAQDRDGSGVPGQSSTGQGAGGASFSVDLDAPGEDQINQAEQRASSALARMQQRSGVGGQNGPGASEDAQAEGKGEGQRGGLIDLGDSSNSQLPDSARKLLAKLGTDLPRVETLSEDSDSRSAQLMRRAEQRLQSGKFFDAEALYRQARNNNPDNPMSRVGLVHAQMAAGLIRSAAFNLRKLLENHPELMNVRYEKDLLPPSDRLKWLQTELNDMVQAGQGGADPGLMLAYLGHQVDSRQLVRYGLATAQSADPADPLLAAARKIWLQSQHDQPGSKPSAEQTGEQNSTAKPAEEPERKSNPAKTPPQGKADQAPTKPPPPQK